MNMDNDGYWLVYSREHNRWWAPNQRGYVRLMKDAGRYDEREAKDICMSGDDDDGGPMEFMHLAPECVGKTLPAPRDKSLRDEFAMAALKGLLSRMPEQDDGGTPKYTVNGIVEKAWQAADAMLSAREQQPAEDEIKAELIAACEDMVVEFDEWDDEEEPFTSEASEARNRRVRTYRRLAAVLAKVKGGGA
jgi:hypothetical protein